MYHILLVHEVQRNSDFLNYSKYFLKRHHSLFIDVLG